MRPTLQLSQARPSMIKWSPSPFHPLPVHILGTFRTSKSGGPKTFPSPKSALHQVRSTGATTGARLPPHRSQMMTRVRQCSRHPMSVLSEAPSLTSLSTELAYRQRSRRSCDISPSISIHRTIKQRRCPPHWRRRLSPSQVQVLKHKKTRIGCRFQVSLAPKASRAAPRGIRDQRGLTLNKLKIALQLGRRAQLNWRETTIQRAIRASPEARSRMKRYGASP